METKVIAAGIIGAGAGVAQTFILREKVDRVYPTKNIPSLKGFGTISALAGLIGGTTGIAVGAIGASKDKTGRQRLPDEYIEAAIDYGVVAGLGGVFSGIFPAVTEADCIAAGGYFYDGACHEAPKPGTVGMEGAPQVQTAAYRAPIPHLENSDAYKKMAAEIQRLNAMNASLQKQMAEVRGGTVVRGPGGPSGFMEDMAARGGGLPQPAELYPVGHPEAGTIVRGFMGETAAKGYGF